MVMELLLGSPADKLIRDAAGRLSVDQVARIAQQSATGLAFAHANGVIHRDIKPANLFVTTSGVVKVLDFGIARAEDASRVTQTGSGQPATPAYFAPELALGAASPSPASDVYAFGITLFELLTGAPPFRSKPGMSPSEAAMSLMYQHVHVTIPDAREIRSDIPAELSLVVRRATSKDPAERYADAGALAQALTTLTPLPLPPSAPRARPTPSVETPSAPPKATAFSVNPVAAREQTPAVRARTTAPQGSAATPARKSTPLQPRTAIDTPRTPPQPVTLPDSRRVDDAELDDQDERHYRKPPGIGAGVVIAIIVAVAGLVLILGLVAGGHSTDSTPQQSEKSATPTPTPPAPAPPAARPPAAPPAAAPPPAAPPPATPHPPSPAPPSRPAGPSLEARTKPGSKAAKGPRQSSPPHPSKSDPDSKIFDL